MGWNLFSYERTNAIQPKEFPMKSLILALLSCLLALPATAQDRPPPALMVKTGEASKPLLLKRVAVDARILGNVAETRLTLTFGNPLDRDLAGDLYIPLPEGSTVSGYALDIAGVMVDGVVVEKDKARQVFEIEVRKGVDPGLVEWVKGNTFKTRVYPIPAGGSRTVMIRYVSEVLPVNGVSRYRLPLDYRDPVDELSIRVEVVKPGAAPAVEAGGPEGLTFDAWRDSFVAEAVVKGKPLTEDLVIRLPIPPAESAAVEVAPDGTCFVQVLDTPKPPGVVQKGKLSRVTILWDASGSRGATDHAREIGLLGKWFSKLPGKVKVDLVLFRHATETRRFTVKKGNAEALLEFLGKVAYDGGTQMGALSPASGKAPDLYLLFSDGLSTFGTEEPTGFKAPVYVLSDDTAANHPFLRHIARSTGGAYFNLRRLADADVLQGMGWSPFSFLRMEVISGALDGVFPDSPRPVAGGFTLAARLRSETAEVILHYGYGSKSFVKKTHRLSRKDAPAGTLLETFWAQKQIQDLLAIPERNRDELIRVGRQFGLVTPGTSLMVLERLDQYVEHSIAPPKSLTEMRAKYFEIVENRKKEAEEEIGRKKEEVLAQWNERVEWWGRTFDYPPDFRIQSEEEKAAEGEDGVVMGTGSGAGAGGVGAGRVATHERREVLRITPASATDMAAPSAEREERSAPMKKCKEKNGGDQGPAPEPKPQITIKPWDPETPYLKALAEAPKGRGFPIYMAQRKEHGTSPAFFLDCAGFFYREGNKQLGLQVLSNVAELELENHRLLRVLGHRLAQQGELGYAQAVFEEVLRLRPEEPQSYRDLALVLDGQDKLPRAMELLYHVVLHEWDRFEGIEIIALMELNRVIAKAKRAGVEEIPVDKRFVKLLDTDVRIILTWDTDMTDMDLWVTEPSGEKAYYSNNRTTIGGLVSRDFTNGYGPEEYLLKKRMTGKYKIEVNFYGSSAPELTGPTTLQVEVFTNYGRPDEERKAITLRLDKAEDVIHVGEVTF